MKRIILVALIVLLMASCQSIPPTPPPTSTERPTATDTYTPIPTTTNLPDLHQLTFTAFHDFNGNGVMDIGEPPLQGILNIVAGSECTTGVDGKCTLVGVQKGKQTINITDQRTVDRYELISFIFSSVSEVQPLSRGLEIIVKDNMEINEPLGQGFLSYPFSQGTPFNVSNFMDLDPTFCPTPDDHTHRCANLLDWQGNKITYDDHTGIDFLASTGTPILAAAPGKVISAGSDSNAGNFVVIQTNQSYVIHYNHMNSVLVNKGDLISRGQEIGKVGSTGNSSIPHLHFEFQVNGMITDPYHNIHSSYSKNYWILLNTPVIK